MTSIIVNIKDDRKAADFISFLRDIEFLEVTVNKNTETATKKNRPTLHSAFGIWKNKDITLSSLRSEAWR
jgi:hypothetical protein